MALILCMKADNPVPIHKRVPHETRGMAIDVREDGFEFSEWECANFEIVKAPGAASEYAFLLERGTVDPETGECAGLRKQAVNLDAISKTEIDPNLGTVKTPTKAELLAASLEATTEKAFAIDLAVKQTVKESVK